MNKIEVQSSKINGQGIFAKTLIKKGEAIFRVEGPVIKYPFEPDYRRDPHSLNIAKNTWKLPLDTSPWRYINHSCAPNVACNGAFEVVALRPIKPGEEITTDYSITEASPSWRLKCTCRQTNCRELIRSVQFLPADLYATYKKYIPRFIQKAYEAEKTYFGQTKTKQYYKGIFAKRSIRKNEIIFIVRGPIVQYDFPVNYRLGLGWLGIGPKTWIMPLAANPWQQINHSCTPNAGLKNKTQVVAMRLIAANEEITIDYAITEAEPDWRMTCHCGSLQCRRIIRSIIWLPPTLFKKYQPYIPKFLQAVFNHRPHIVWPKVNQTLTQNYLGRP